MCSHIPYIQDIRTYTNYHVRKKKKNEIFPTTHNLGNPNDFSCQGVFVAVYLEWNYRNYDISLGSLSEDGWRTFYDMVTGRINDTEILSHNQEST